MEMSSSSEFRCTRFQKGKPAEKVMDSLESSKSQNPTTPYTIGTKMNGTREYTRYFEEQNINPRNTEQTAIHLFAAGGNITQRSSLGLLSGSVLADVTNLNPGESFWPNMQILAGSQNIEDKDNSVSILREHRNTTFKLPAPRPMQMKEYSMIYPQDQNDSIQTDAHVPYKYLLPMAKENGSGGSDTPLSPSLGWVEERVTSFIAKNPSEQDESLHPSTEADWSNVFEKLKEKNDGPSIAVGEDEQPPRAGDSFSYEPNLGHPRAVCNQSFSAEALSISLANRPRSTSFGSSPNKMRDDDTNTRNERFSDFSNPPESKYKTIDISDTTLHRKIQGISYLEDTVFDNPKEVEDMSNYFGAAANISLGGFPPEHLDIDFEINPRASNNFDFINKAEAEFQDEHRFEQFENPEASMMRSSKDTFHLNMSCQVTGPSKNIINGDMIEDKLSQSQYFALSTSRLGSLEGTPDQINTSNMSFYSCQSLMPNGVSNDRPNLGFPQIVSPKRIPVPAITLTDFGNKTSIENKGDKTELKMDKYRKPNKSSENSYKSMNTLLKKPNEGAERNDGTFKRPFAPTIDQFKDFRGIPGPLLKTKAKHRHSSPIKLDLQKTKYNENSLSWSNKNIQLATCNTAPLSIQKNIANAPLIYTETKNNTIRNRIVRFPLEADKTFLAWLAVGTGHTEERSVNINNPTDQAVDFRLIIRDSVDFSFKLGHRRTLNSVSDSADLEPTPASTNQPINSSNVIEAVLHPHETKCVVVQFTPSNSRENRGKLVIKPKTLKNKATIILFANVGLPKIVFDDSFGLTAGHSPNHITMLIGNLSNQQETTKFTQISNNGDAVAYVRLQPFADTDCRIKCQDKQTDPITVDPKAFILKPGCFQTIKISAHPCDGLMEGEYCAVGGMLILSGPDICRQAHLASKKNKAKEGTTLRKPILVHGVDFDTPFLGENEAEYIQRKLNMLWEDQESEFESKMTTTFVKIVGVKSKLQFHQLQVEETLSESRINCTVVERSRFGSIADTPDLPAVQMYDTIPEEKEIEMPIPKNYRKSNVRQNEQNESNKCTVSSNKKEEPHTGNPKGVAIKYPKLFFPPTKVGTQRTEKLVIENRNENAISLMIDPIEVPFSSSHAKIDVKSKSFLKVPIQYEPTNVGKHKVKITIKSETGIQLEALLFGDGLR